LNPTPAPAPPAAVAPLLIAYSDWPGWVAWDIALHKHWFDAAGVKVDFKWFEYVPSMEAFSAGKVDACGMTNGDQLVTGASGAPSVAILINDYSNGNDMVVARAGIDTVEQLKGKKVGVEVGFVSHLLLLNALKAHKLTPKDITIVNVPTDQTPQALKSGSVDAIVAWQPNSGQALKEVAGSKPVFTSKNAPGIIYDVLAVNPKSLAERHADWEKVVDVWFQVADFLADKKNEKEALEIMSGRVSLTPEQYAPAARWHFPLGRGRQLEALPAGYHPRFHRLLEPARRWLQSREQRVQGVAKAGGVSGQQLGGGRREEAPGSARCRSGEVAAALRFTAPLATRRCSGRARG
jgi:NitT/TauT family transport system substrate-binding protein